MRLHLSECEIGMDVFQEPSGIPALDMFHSGPAIAIIGNFSLYKVAVVDRVKEAGGTWSELRDVLSITQPGRSTNFIVARYVPSAGAPLDEKVVFNTLLERMLRYKCLLASSLFSDGSVVVLMRNDDCKYLPSLQVMTVVPQLYTLARGNSGTCHHILSVFACCASNTRTNMDIVPGVVDAPSLEQLLHKTAGLTEPDLRVLRATILLKPAAERTEGEAALLRVLPSM